MRYPGPFTFINRNSTTVEQGKRYRDDTAIVAHIARTKSKWTEEKRLAEMRGDANGRAHSDTHANVHANAHAHTNRLTGWESRKRRDVGGSLKVTGDIDIDVEIEGTEILPLRSTAITPGIQRASDRKHSSCIRICPRCTKRLITKDTGISVPSHRCNYTRTPSCTVASALPVVSTTAIPRGNGNTDPFSASVIPITPRTHALLLFSAHLYVFWAWPAAASHVFRRNSQDMWVRAVQGALGGTVEMKVIIAAGARVRARLLRDAGGGVKGGYEGCEEQDKGAEQEALRWKASALRDLREKTLMVMDSQREGRDYLQAVFRWVSLEYYEGNFEAAWWHHRAATEVVGRITGRVGSGGDDGVGIGGGPSTVKTATYAVAEVWAATAVLEKPLPCGMVDFSGERIASRPDEDVVPVPHSSHTFYLYEVEWWDVHVSIVSPTLKRLFWEIRKVILYMDALGAQAEDPVATFETVAYLGAQSSKLRAEILGLWVDHGCNGREMSLGGVNEHPHGPGAKMEDLVFSASCLAALLFINIIFMYKPNSLNEGVPATRLMSPAVNRQALLRLQEALRDLRWHHMQWDGTVDEGRTVDLELLTWLSFMAALGETLEAEAICFPALYRSRNLGAGDASDDGVGKRCFQECCMILGVRDWQELKSMLVKFLFFGGLMDGYLASFFNVLYKDSVLWA